MGPLVNRWPMRIDKTTLATISLEYRGDVLAAMLEAWEANPTYKTDCTAKRLEKEHQRRKWVKTKLGIDKLQ